LDNNFLLKAYRRLKGFLDFRLKIEMEDWSDGFFLKPTLQHSNAPILHPNQQLQKEEEVWKSHSGNKKSIAAGEAR